MGYTMKKGIMEFIVLPVVILCVALLVIIPMASAAINAIFGSSVTTDYKASVVELTNNKAILEWNEDRFVLDKNIYTKKQKVIGLSDFKYVKVGDTFDISVTAPGLLQKLGSNSQEDVEIKDHNLNVFSYLWRAMKGE